MTVKLHLGAGDNSRPGWINLDNAYPQHAITHQGAIRKYWSAPRLEEFENNSVDYVFHQHFIEHLDEATGFTMLQEIYRVLKPGGVIRSCTPSLDKYVEAFLHGEFNTGPLAAWRNGSQFLNYAIYGEGWTNKERVFYLKELRHTDPPLMRSPGVDHRYIYSEEDLAEKLAFIGFKNPHAVAWGKSDSPDLCGLETHAEGTLLELIMEAHK